MRTLQERALRPAGAVPPGRASAASAASCPLARRRTASRPSPSRWCPCRSGTGSMWVFSSGWNDEVIGDALGVVVARSPFGAIGAEQRLGVRPGEAAEPGRDTRAACPSSCSRCSSRWVPSAPAANTTCSAVNVLARRRRPRAGPFGGPRPRRTRRRRAARTAVTVVSGWTCAPALLGEVEVVLDQGVLRAVPAAGHALAALDAARARRARRRRSTGRPRRAGLVAGPPKNTPTGVGWKVSPDAHLARRPARITLVGGRGGRVRRPRRASAWPGRSTAPARPASR